MHIPGVILPAYTS